MKSRLPHFARLTCLVALFIAGIQAQAGNPPATQHHHQQETFTTSFNDRVSERLNLELVSLLTSHLLDSGDVSGLATYFSADLIQHDPKIADGRAAMLSWIASQRALAPAQTLTVKHVLADRDLVFVHSQLSATPANEKSGRNRFDFYRLDRGVIVEHWAVSARVATETESGNSQFSNLYVYSGHYRTPVEVAEEKNRLLVVALSDRVFDKRQFNLLDSFWATDYLQHNPYVGNGRAALAEVMPYISPEGSHYRIVRSMADGDLSVVCSQNTDPGVDPTDQFTGAAVCDLYRVVDFKLVEHWDVGQGVPATTLNGHSMFSNLYRSH